MRILADTHVLLWWLADDERLTPVHREALADPAHQIWFSAVSIAEIAIKSSLGKLTAPGEPAEALLAGGFLELSFSAGHAERLRTLPWHHGDSFDRMLISQAQVEQMVLATVDRRFADYEVGVV